MKVCIICIAKNEHNYINEWINWHLNLGFDNIIICDNDEENNLLKINNDKVIILDYSNQNRYLQSTAYTKTYKEYKNNYDWIAFIDCDEFIILEDKYKTIKDFLSDTLFNNTDIIRLHWKVFSGGNELDVINNDYSVMNRFTERYKMAEECWGKSFLKTSSIELKENEKIFGHGYFSNQNLNVVNAVGEKCINKWSYLGPNPIYKNAWINHYPTKTIGEYIRYKFFRGGPNNNDHKYNSLKYFFNYNEYNKEKENYAFELLKIKKNKFNNIYTGYKYKCRNNNDIDVINNYLNTNKITKLHLGCGVFPIDGWLNTDKESYRLNPNILYLDVSKKFELPDNSFNYIYSEHLFEHLTFNEGQNMLKECYRILKPNGIIRLSTPNLQFLIDLYLHPEKEINKAYIEFDGKRAKQPNNAIYAINHFHTDWGHKIIYDPESLISILKDNKFKNIHQCEVGKSNYTELNNIEQHSKHFERIKCKYDYNILQSMVFEAEK